MATRRVLIGAGLLVCGVPRATSAQQATGPATIREASADDIAAGRRLFQTQCTRCHGFDGSGGLGPALTVTRFRRAPDDSALFSLLRQGISGTAMEGDWSLSDRETAQIAAYVITLGRVAPVPVPGDSARGATIYADKGGCPACHILGGQGAAIGPDLTNVGGRRGPAYLRRALEHPEAELPRVSVPYEPGTVAAYLPVGVVTRDGTRHTGLRVTEDAFTLQLRDATGHLLSFRKQELRLIERRFGQSVMPAVAGTLLPSELDDLIAYLSRLR